jgi:molybdate transport system substrate-binding protein
MTGPVLSAISSMATRSLLGELCEACEQAGGARVQLESVGGVDAARRVEAGEVFDLVVLAADAIDKLADAGRVVADSRCVLAQSSVAIAVRAGAARPDVGSETALREAVLAADRIGVSTGPSGVALLAVFERWGVLESLRERIVQARPGQPVAALLARGEVALGFQQLSELKGEPGIALLGPMPPGLEIVTRFVGAVGAGSAQREAARAALAFFAAPARADIRRRHGMV